MVCNEVVNYSESFTLRTMRPEQLATAAPDDKGPQNGDKGPLTQCHISLGGHTEGSRVSLSFVVFFCVTFPVKIAGDTKERTGGEHSLRAFVLRSQPVGEPAE